jgi:uncharacterized protein (DUF2141 family)
LSPGIKPVDIAVSQTLSVLVCALVMASVALPAQQRDAVLPIRGQVVDADTGVPLVRARVIQTTVDADPVFTNDQGEFDVEKARPGAAGLRITKAGYVAWQQTVAEAAATPLRVLLTRGAAINGRVVDQYGRAEASVFVVARAAGSSDREPPAGRQFSAQVDALGDYRLGGLPPGRYAVRAMRERDMRKPPNLSREELLFGPPTYVDVGTDGIEVTLKPGDDIADISFSMPGPAPDCGPRDSQRPAPGIVRASIHGRVTGVSGEPLPCAQVIAQSPDASVPPASTDDQGYYTIYGLPAGTFTLAVQASGYVSLNSGLVSDGQRQAITLRAGEARDGADFTLRRLGMLSGTVRDEHGEPLEGIAMTSFRVGRKSDPVVVMPEAFRPVTDDRGQYRLFNLQPGRYVVSATAK